MEFDFFSKGDDGIIAESSIMKNMIQRVAKIAKSNANVFISGESGSGKEVMAKLIHSLSKRNDKSFIRVNCAAMPDTLIESEFFGHEKGAFTGALNRHFGRFELADSGTLLLDEISEIPLHLQAKLLRVVQEQEFERIGGTHPIKVDVRLISTSNRIMKDAIEEKLFREDLYYRLNVVPLHLPPLRERKEDIIPLAYYFLKQTCKKNDISEKLFSADAEEKLLNYRWPGNIRELSNLIEQIVVMIGNDVIYAKHIDLDPSSPDQKIPVIPKSSIPLKELEKMYILETLKSFQYNRTKAAKALGITTRTLRNKLKVYKSV